MIAPVRKSLYRIAKGFLNITIMAYFHCRCENGSNEAVVVSTEEAERLIESGELVTSDPFEAMGWESEASIYGR